MTNTLKLKPVVHKYPDEKPNKTGYYITDQGVLIWSMRNQSFDYDGVTKWIDTPNIGESIEVQEPEGWQLVPKLQTNEQIKALMNEIRKYSYIDLMEVMQIYAVVMKTAPRYGEEQ